MAGANDHYWEKSVCTPFNFDDDEEDLACNATVAQDLETSTDQVFNFLTFQDIITLPIHSIISRTSLDLILHDLNLPEQYSVPCIDDTVRKIFLGKPCVLGHYRTLEQKLELLDKAIGTLDGNTIVKVVLYLKNSLQSKLLYYHLTKRKMALRHYSNYLAQHNRNEELGELYMASGNSNDMINLFYLACKNFSSKDRLRLHLNQFISEYASSVSDYDRTVLKEFQSFAAWQINKEIMCDSVTEQLCALFKSKLEKNESLDEITKFKSLIKISNMQYEWIQLNTMAALEMWSKLTGMFIKPNLFKKNVIKSVISTDLILNLLHKHGAPKNILQEFLICISDDEKSLELGRKMQCHRFVIDKLIENRDRQGLIEYRKYLPSQSEEFFHLEKNLSSERRWKN